jgi:hypothetical protein
MDLKYKVEQQVLLTEQQYQPPVQEQLTKYKTDEFGFIILNTFELSEHKHPKRALWKKVSRGIGRGNHKCKGLCRLLPHRNSRHVSYSKTGEYFCVCCEIAMKCCRCHCCGRQGRAEPRGRHFRQSKKDAKYIE